VPLGSPPFNDMAWVPGGTFLMESDHYYPEEAPAHSVTLDGFWMDKYTVTNREFRRFVETRGCVTLAERPPNPDDFPGAPKEKLIPGSEVFQKTAGPGDLRNTGMSHLGFRCIVRVATPVSTMMAAASAAFHVMARLRVHRGEPSGPADVPRDHRSVRRLRARRGRRCKARG
jgi:hypothetical protein